MAAPRSVNCLYNGSRVIYRSLTSTSRCEVAAWRRAPHVSVSQSSTQARFYAGPPKRKPAPTIRQRVEEEEAKKKTRNHDPRYMTQGDIDKSGKQRLPQDHEITDPQVMVLENGIIEGPLAPRYVISKLEEGESLRMIQPYVPADGKAEPPMAARFAVCKIVNKKEEYDRLKQIKEKKKATGAKKGKLKELDFMWGIEENDLMTKMRLMEKLLEKGHKIDVVISPRKRGSSNKVVTTQEMENLVKTIRQEADQAGGREAKAAEGRLGGTIRIQFERRGTK